MIHNCRILKLFLSKDNNWHLIISTGIDQPDWMLVVIALNQSSEELPGMLDVALLGVGSWEASVSFTETTSKVEW